MYFHSVSPMTHLHLPNLSDMQNVGKGALYVRLARLYLMPSQRGRTCSWDPGSWAPRACDIQGSPKVEQSDPAQRALSKHMLLENYKIFLENLVFFFLEVISHWEK